MPIGLEVGFVECVYTYFVESIKQGRYDMRLIGPGLGIVPFVSLISKLIRQI